jgi:hypothetical protein
MILNTYSLTNKFKKKLPFSPIGTLWTITNLRLFHELSRLLGRSRDQNSIAEEIDLSQSRRRTDGPADKADTDRLAGGQQFPRYVVVNQRPGSSKYV